MRLPALLLNAAVVTGLSAPWICARAQEDAPVEVPPAEEAQLEGGTPEEAAPLTPAERLKAAVRTYQGSQVDEAQVLLAGLVNDESYTDESLRQEARVYLGEVLYRKQDQEAARRVFERVLTIDPDYRIDPFRHPPDVCGFFETIRAYIQPPKAPEPGLTGPVPPLPALGYMGFGIYQLQHGRSAVGGVMLAAQTLTGVLSFVEFADLLADRGYDPEDPEDRNRLLRRRTLQWASTGMFYSVWGWGILDAGRHWRANINVRPSASPAEGPPLPRPPGIQLQVSGRFR